MNVFVTEPSIPEFSTAFNDSHRSVKTPKVTEADMSRIQVEQRKTYNSVPGVQPLTLDD